MEFSQVFNITYIFIAILLVAYFWVIGNGVKKYAKFVKIPTIITGFFATMLLWSPIFLFTHITSGVEYKGYFIAYMILTTILSLSWLRKDDLKFKSTYGIAIVSGIWIVSLLYALFNNSMRGNIHQDYWLYGQWMSDSSRFVSSAIRVENETYFYSVFYRFFGSFIGMIQSIPMVDQELALANKEFLPIIQTPLSLVLVVFMYEMFDYVVKRKNFITIGMFAVITILTETYQSVLIGSYLLWIITTIAIVDLIRNENDERVIGILLGTMVYFTSSVLLIAVPLLVIYRLAVKKNQNFINFAVLFILLKFAIANYAHGHSMTMYIYPAIALIIYIGFNKMFDKPVMKVIQLIEKYPMILLALSFITILTFNILDHDDDNSGIILLLSMRIAGLVLVTFSGYVFYKNDNSSIFIYMLVATAMFANPIVYLIINSMDGHSFKSIIHRFTQNSLTGEMASYPAFAIILPWLTYEIIDRKAT